MSTSVIMSLIMTLLVFQCGELVIEEADLGCAFVV